MFESEYLTLENQNWKTVHRSEDGEIEIRQGFGGRTCFE